MTEIPQIPPAELSEDHPYLIVDVREESEWQFVHLAGSFHLPLGEIPLRLNQLPTDRPLLMLCHHGMRSQRAAEILARRGYRVANLAGGIDRWSRERDPELPRY